MSAIAIVPTPVIPVASVLPNPEQPRREFEPVAMQELADSIKANGVLQPILVEQAEVDRYILHDGERRLRAARMAGLEYIPAIVGPPLNGSGRQDRLLRALVANLHRRDLSPIEEARAFDALRREHSLTLVEISKRTGKHASFVHQRLALVKLDPEIQSLIEAGNLTSDSGVAGKLMKISDPTTRVRLANTLASRRASIKACSAAIDKILGHQAVVTKGSDPCIEFAHQRSRKRNQDLPTPRWDALQQAGRVPRWEIVAKAARNTCKSCTLRDISSPETCGACPAVEMLIGIMEAI